MDGWVGNILRVNLSSEDYVVEDLDSEIAKKFIGGQGLASKILFAEVDPTVDPLSPENKLIFSTGPLTGTGAVCGARAWWVAKSPLTGTIGFTCTGGYFPAEIKFAGYDMIIFEGKADNPVYLWIEDDEVEIRSAIDLWSKDTSEVEDLIRNEIKDSWKARETRIACIGPAGENLVKLASIINDKHRAAGRGGLGAVMGSKNLKAVSVIGTGSVRVADPDALMEARSWFIWNYSYDVDHPRRQSPRDNFPLYGVITGSPGTMPLLVPVTEPSRPQGCVSCPRPCRRKTKSGASNESMCVESIFYRAETPHKTLQATDLLQKTRLGLIKTLAFGGSRSRPPESFTASRTD